MFVFQRISGIVTLIFISWHVWETRIQAMLGKEVNYDMMADILNNPAMFAFYLVGVVSAISTLQMDYGHSASAGELQYLHVHKESLLM